MQTRLIELLKNSVSSIVLDGETDYLIEKNRALNDFYPVFLSVLRHRPSLIDSLRNQLNPRLAEIFGTNLNLKQQFLEFSRSQAPADEIESTLNRAIVPTLGFLESEAGSTDPEAIVHLLDQHMPDIQAALPEWAAALLAGLGVNTTAGQTIHQAPELYEEVPEQKRSPWVPILIFIILALLLAFLFKACSDRNEEEVPVTQAAATEPAYLQVNTGSNGDLVTCQLYLNNPAYTDILQTEVKRIFNHPTGCGVNSASNYHSEFIDQDVIPTALKILKDVPNTNMTWMGEQIAIQSTNPADAQRVANQLRPLAKNMTITVQQDLDVQTVTPATTTAAQALAVINPDNIQALDVATALNLEAIHFESASSTVPEANQPILDQAAALIQRAPHVHLTIKGHTDAVGSNEANNLLSLRRAEAVRDYLVQRGVDPSQLQAVGYGQQQPMEPNATPEGQFQNRRIEFEVLNTETGVVRAVDDQGIVEKKAE
ncbi:OmpA family protein [Acinetobacter indicus]|uniref:OmpA family protein n=1 Tax=Acinetobacter indicus TaxID=756892 RepID=UPI001443B336|nr:OmpA family protein [Acinetobacter indicus]